MVWGWIVEYSCRERFMWLSDLERRDFNIVLQVVLHRMRLVSRSI